MNKQVLKSTLMAIMLLVSAFSYAETFFVCNGTPFTLFPDAGSPAFGGYEWKLGSVSVSTTDSMHDTQTLSVATTAEMFVYTLSVQNTSTLCWSDLQYDTVYVLPALTTTITGDTLFCSNEGAVSSTLTAEIPTLDLTAVTDGSVSQDYAWTTTGSGTANGNTYNAADSGTYSVKVTYVLPDNDGEKLDVCWGNASVHIVIAPAPTAPVVKMQ